MSEPTRPLPPGTEISYCDLPAVITRDDGGDTVEVVAEGCKQTWYWKLAGVECVVTKLP